MTRRFASLILVSLALAGCAGTINSTWSAGYNPSDGQFPKTSEVRIQPAPFDSLENNPGLDGYSIVGTSTFTAQRQDADPSDPQGPLANHAKSVGATLVRVGIRPAGTETQTRYIRTTTPSTGTPGGNIASGRALNTERGEIPIDVEVDVFDHIAVFYRELK